MQNLSIKFNNMEQSKKEYKEQINRLLAEAKILMYEIEAITKKGVSSRWTLKLEHMKHKTIHTI